MGSLVCAQAMSYPLLISAAGIICCLLTTFIATDLRPARMVSEIENTLKYQLIISTLLATPVRPSCSAVSVVPSILRGLLLKICSLPSPLSGQSRSSGAGSIVGSDLLLLVFIECSALWWEAAWFGGLSQGLVWGGPSFFLQRVQ